MWQSKGFRAGNCPNRTPQSWRASLFVYFNYSIDMYCAAWSTYISLCKVAFGQKPLLSARDNTFLGIGKSPYAVGSHTTAFVYIYHVHILSYYVYKSCYPKRIHNSVLLRIFCFHLKLKNKGGKKKKKKKDLVSVISIPEKKQQQDTLHNKLSLWNSCLLQIQLAA